jgi:glycosyltransferase involved in cell wall biosynthesis
MQEINILHLLSSFYVGGLEKLLLEQIREHKVDSGFNFVIVVMNDKVDEDLRKELSGLNCKVYFLDRPQSHIHPKYLLKLLNIIKSNNIHIIHSHNPGAKSWSILCKLINPNLKLVYTFHSSVIIKELSKIKLFLHQNFIDKNIAISDAIYNDCFNNALSKTIKIYNGINTQKFACSRNDATNKDILNITNIARVCYRIKGQDVLLKALRECKNRGLKFICNFIGGIYDYDLESYEYLKKLVQELNLEEEVFFLGNRNDIPELLQKSDLFILPSRYEGMPIALLEAMAAGLPVIASNISGSSDLITSEGNGLLFESENHLDLTEKIMDLYNNQEKLRFLAGNAFVHVQNLDISIMHRKYCELYKLLVFEK